MGTGNLFSRLTFFGLLFLVVGNLAAQDMKEQVYVDKKGVMRWSKDRSELYGFGVNYTIPFAHEYREALRRGISPEDAIRQDVYHMARLDLDFYRVHVWDTEISDTLGNLIENEHLQLFDFLISEMKARGMHFIITPIAYWGNGWPEPDYRTPGFSAKYGKDACLTEPEAIKAQEKYLFQFVNHINPYTGKAYKDDDAVIGFEISNEPHHAGTRENVTAFINTMVSSIRKTGCKKLLFYNMSHSIHLADAYLDADIQGGTFQWYPTGLVANHQVEGNFLPHVASYTIPFASDPDFRKLAKIVYEFDAADAAGNYMYPAMASTFRESGMQLAAQFAYDAMFNAPWNTNYGTHFMNLAYAPNKAISLKIASAIFHNQPLYSKNHESLHISYVDDLAEWIDSDKYFYSNTTKSIPPDIIALREIAGCGSSPVVMYSGTGAYFLDKIADGLWRLEIMPDAYWIKDPYSPVNPRIQKTAVVHSLRQMSVSLPDLGNDFYVQPINSGNTFKPAVVETQFDIRPGTYLIRSKNLRDVQVNPNLRNLKMDEFAAPPTDLRETTLLNDIPTEATAGKMPEVSFTAVSALPVKSARVILSDGLKRSTVNCKDIGGGRFSVLIPEDFTGTGFLNYYIIIETEKDTVMFPGGLRGTPFSWENRNSDTYTIRIVDPESPMFIWDPETDWNQAFKIWNRDVRIVPSITGADELYIKPNELPAPDPLNPASKCYAFKFCFQEKISGRKNELPRKSRLVIELVNNQNEKQTVEVGLIDSNGSVITKEISIARGDTVCSLPLAQFHAGDFLVIPRPYPDFLPFKVRGNKIFELKNAQTLQVMIKPLNGTSTVDLRIGKIWLE